MAILVTRPYPDSEATAARLRALGHDVLLAPVMRLDPLGFEDETADDLDAVIVTSANALRAIAPQLRHHQIVKLPLFAVGEHTASVARETGFDNIIIAGGDAAALRQTILHSARSKALPKRGRLLYLAGADRSGDLAGELAAAGLDVVTRTTYRMVPVARLPGQVSRAFASHGIEAVLHYSRRSARAFLEAAREAGVEISALAIAHCCLSRNVAAVLREAGAAQVLEAAAPDENALFDALARALRFRLA